MVAPKKPKRPWPKRPADVTSDHDEDRSELGQTVTISASVPKRIVESIRRAVGKREFSRFVTRSLQRELVRMSRLEHVAEFEALHGPLSREGLEHARRMIEEW